MTNYHSESAYAVFNAGRWIVRCPECARKGMQIAAEVKPGKDFICPFENPGIVANMPVAVELTEKEKAAQHRMGVRALFKIRGVPDQEMRLEALAGSIRYKVIWPSEKKQIEALLRTRPAQAMNWEPGETLEFVQAENAMHGM